MNKPIDDGGSAFPLTSDAISYDNREYDMQGMSLRDHIAISIMANMHSGGWRCLPEKVDDMIDYAYGIADRVIAARAAKEADRG